MATHTESIESNRIKQDSKTNQKKVNAGARNPNETRVVYEYLSEEAA